MKSRALIDKKTQHTRRNIIIYILVTILILGVVAGFTDPFKSDSTVHKATFGETIVMEQELPAQGKPSDYDLISNLKFAAYKLHHAKFFRGETTGTAVADLSITGYVQNIHNVRVSTGDVVFAEAISSSALKSVAEQKYADNGVIIYRPSVSVSGNTAKFSDTAYPMTYETFSEKYGTVPNQLSKYIINEKTILAVKDENATEAKSSGAITSDAGMDFYVPQNLTRGEDGNYKFTLTLDPTESTLYYRNEVRTMGGADQNPTFSEVSVTVTIDENWNPVSVESHEVYKIAIPFIGAMTCVGNLSEVFSEIDAEDGVMPESEFFRPYVEQAKNDPNFTLPEIPPANNSPADYLATAFASYLDGTKDLDLLVDVKSDKISAYDNAISVNLKTMDIKAKVGNLYVRYLDDKVYLDLNKIHGYMDISRFSEVLSSGALTELFGPLPDFGSLDLNSLFGGNILETVFQNCEMTTENNVTSIKLSFDADLKPINEKLGSANISAAININDDDKTLRSIIGDIKLGDIALSVEAQTLDKFPAFPSTDNAVDLSDIADFIPDILNTATQKAFNVDGTVKINDIDAKVNGYIDINNGIAADVTVNIYGIDVNIKFIGDTVYVTVGNIAVRGTVAELPELFDALESLVGFDMSGVVGALKPLLPTTVADYIKMLSTLEVTDDSLSLGANILTVPVKLVLKRDGGALSQIGAAVELDKFGIKLDAAVALDITYPEAREVSAPAAEEYLTFKDLADILAAVKPYIESETDYALAISGTVSGNAVKGNFTVNVPYAEDDGLSVSGSLVALGRKINATYVDGTVYISVGNLRFKLDVDDIASLKDPVFDLVGMFVELPEISLDEMITSVTDGTTLSYKDGQLCISLDVSGMSVTATVDISTGKLAVKSDMFDLAIEATATDTQKHTAPVGEYIDIAELGETLDAVTDILTNKGITASLSLDIPNMQKLSADLALSFEDGLKLRITEKTLGAEITVIGKAFYLTLGDIKLSGSLDDLSPMLDMLKDSTLLPNDLSGLLGSLSNVQSTETAELVSTVLDAVKSLSLNEGIINLDAALNGNALSAEVFADLKYAKLGIAGMTVEVNDITATKVTDITAPDDTNFIQAAELVEILPFVLDLVETDKYSLSFGTSITVKETEIAVNGNMDMLRSGTTFSLVGKVNLLGQTADVTLIDNTLYLSLGNINLKLALADAPALLPQLSELLAAVNMPMPELPEFDKTDVLGTVKTVLDLISDITVQDGVLSATINMNGMTLGATADTTTGGITLNVNGITLDASLSAPESVQEPQKPNGEYIDIAELGETLDAVTDILTNKGITASLSLDIPNMQKLSADLALSFEDGLKFRVTEKTLGAEITVIGKAFYLTLGDIKLPGTLDDLSPMLDMLKDSTLLPNDLSGLLGSLSGMSSAEITDIVSTVLDAVKSLSLNEGIINLDAALNGNALSAEVFVDLKYAKLGIAGMTVEVNDITATKVTDITAPDDTNFIQAAELVEILPFVLDLVETDKYSLSFGTSITVKETEIAVSGNMDMLRSGTAFSLVGKVNLLGQTADVTLIDNTLYLSLGNINLKLALADAPALLPQLSELLAAVNMPMPELPEFDKTDILGTVKTVLDLISDVTVQDGVLSATINMNGMTLGATADTTTGDITLNVNGIILGANLSMPESVQEPQKPSGEYIDIAELGETLDAVTPILTNKGITASLSLDIPNMQKLSADVALSFEDGLKLRITEKTLGAEITVIGKAFYLTLGDIKLSGTLDDLSPMLDLLVECGVLKQELATQVSGMLASDTAGIVDTVLDMIKSLALNDGELNADVSAFGAVASLGLPVDLSRVQLGVTVSDKEITADADIAASPVVIAAPSIAEVKANYVPVKNVLDIVKKFIPFVKTAVANKALRLDIVGALPGYVTSQDGNKQINAPINGYVYIDFGAPASLANIIDDLYVRAELGVGDISLLVTVKDKTLYLAVDNMIKVKTELSLSSLYGVLDSIGEVLPDIADTVKTVIDALVNADLMNMLLGLKLSPAENGFAASLDLDMGVTANGVALKAIPTVSLVKTDDGVLMDANIALYGNTERAFGISLGISTGSDRIGIYVPDNTPLALGVTVTSEKEEAPAGAPENYTELSALTRFISPIAKLITDGKTAKSLHFEFEALALIDGKTQSQTTIKGSADIALAKKVTDENGVETLVPDLSVSCSLTLFAGNNESVVDIRYTDGGVYISSGNIKLSLDTSTDLDVLYDILDKYLPGYVMTEIGKLTGRVQGASAFSEISLIAERIAAVATSPDMQNTIGLLFSPLGALGQDRSVLAAISDMITIDGASGTVRVAADIMGLTINVLPVLESTEDGDVLASAQISTNIAFGGTGMYVRLDLTDYSLDKKVLILPDVTDKAEYISVADFLCAIDNAVSTFTSVSDENGDIAFTVNDFEFDYDMYKFDTDANGEVKKDENGYPVRILDKHVDVKKNGGDNTPALAAKLIKVETENGGTKKTEYKFNLEAHIFLDIKTPAAENSTELSSQIGMPISLDLYVINDKAGTRAENGFAFVDYMEYSGSADAGYTPKAGERIYIDYDSIMQILASALDILGMSNNETVDRLFGEYRLDINKSVFESMDIVGLKDIQILLDNVLKAAESVKTALADIRSAWDDFYTAGSIDALNTRLPSITEKVRSAIDGIKSAVALFAEKQTAGEEQNPEQTVKQIDGKLFNSIVNGVTLEKTAETSEDGKYRETLAATVENSMTTGSEGAATVCVTQSKTDEADRNAVLDSIKVSNLDASTAKVNGLSITFSAGGEFDITPPENYKSPLMSGNTTLADSADFGKAKHLLFDVMNTANMLEFEIGGGADDSINVTIDIKITKIIANIKYRAKVILIDQGEGASPRYKTAVDLELNIPETTAMGIKALPKVTTRLFFYDNVLYMHGVDSWSYGLFSGYKINYIDGAYTVDEFLNTAKDDIGKLFKQFVFKLLPLREEIIGINIHDQIINAILKPGTLSPDLKTFAQIFKGYKYENGEHSLKIGLKELSLNKDLRDLDVTLVGRNDGVSDGSSMVDDNILDNYIYKAVITTNFIDMVDMRLTATLNNANTVDIYYLDADFTTPSPDNAVTKYVRSELKSDGFNATNINGKNYSLTGGTCKGISTTSIIDTLLAEITCDENGKIISVANRPGGTQWTRPWA